MNYPTATHAQISFTIDIIDPCMTSTLTLPTTLLDVSIYSISGVGTSQLFAPAVNNAEIAASILGLCGPRVYSIAELQP